MFLSEGAPNYFPNSFTGPLDNLKYSPQTVKVNEASCITCMYGIESDATFDILCTDRHVQLRVNFL